MAPGLVISIIVLVLFVGIPMLLRERRLRSGSEPAARRPSRKQLHCEHDFQYVGGGFSQTPGQVLCRKCGIGPNQVEQADS